MFDMPSVERDVLYVLAGEDNLSGTEIGGRLQPYYNKDMQTTGLYHHLDSLAEGGFVEKEETKTRRNEYTLTHRGIREIKAHEQWQQQFLRDNDKFDTEDNSSKESGQVPA